MILIIATSKSLIHADIDYMNKSKVFTLGENFPLSEMRAFIDDLHSKDQHYIVMVDPAVAAQDYPSYNNGLDMDIFLRNSDGTVFKGEVWPGVTAFPDWFHSNAQDYWDKEFASFFDVATGIDIDALWIDMNEPSNFCEYPCDNPGGTEDSVAQPEVHGFDAQGAPSLVATTPAAPLQAEVRKHVPQASACDSATHQAVGMKKGLLGRDLISPLYKINNHLGLLSNRTADTDLIHQGGWTEYDTHNL